MAQYQILARKFLGTPGTGPKQTLEVKNSVATPPRVRRTAGPLPARRAAHCRTRRGPPRATVAHGGSHLRAHRAQVGGRCRAPPCAAVAHRGPAICTVAARSCSATVRTLQCRRAHATVPPCARYSAAMRTLQCRRAQATVPPCRRAHATVPPSARYDAVVRTLRCRRAHAKALAPTKITGKLALQGIQLAVGSQPLWLRNHNFGLTHRIMVKRLATSLHDPLGITDSACKNQLVVVSVQYGPFNTYIPIRSTSLVNRESLEIQ
ncbi:hypothetical protein F511_03968 [Dorcoceras hygrometricum]|uniref:Uncharacterized protein n=1 Tax=Dorcoceras hygrometricum TaxID=472368 RepID=A0A2Z7B7Q1_9LAMI|nr:hypothetical protein F511_03968 [Dorcoceras hygrometricum]